MTEGKTKLGRERSSVCWFTSQMTRQIQEPGNPFCSATWIQISIFKNLFSFCLTSRRRREKKGKERKWVNRSMSSPGIHFADTCHICLGFDQAEGRSGIQVSLWVLGPWNMSWSLPSMVHISRKLDLRWNSPDSYQAFWCGMCVPSGCLVHCTTVPTALVPFYLPKYL